MRLLSSRQRPRSFSASSADAIVGGGGAETEDEVWGEEVAEMGEDAGEEVEEQEEEVVVVVVDAEPRSNVSALSLLGFSVCPALNSDQS